jgi:hypothetical protein
MAAFATLDELKGRLDWTLDADEERIANGALEDASELARGYGNKPWADAATAPRMVKTLVLVACARYMRNPEGYVQSRAGDETLAWDELGDKAGSVYFTDREIKLLSGLGGKGGIISAPITAWNGRVRKGPGYVPVEGGGDPFPLFADTEEPW